MPPAIRTLPSGRSVAECPERGSSIGGPDVSDPGADEPRAAARRAKANERSAPNKKHNWKPDRCIGEPRTGRRLQIVLVSNTGCSGSREFPFLARFVLHDVPRHRARGYRQRKGKDRKS